MGGSQSKGEDSRAVAVSRVLNDEGQITVEVTEDLAADIYQKIGNSTQENDYVPARTSSFSEGESQLLLSLEKERLKNKEYKEVTIDEIARVSNSIQQRLKNSPLAKTSPICADISQRVGQCYLGNPGKPLNCSQDVRDYVNCIQHEMKERLLKS